MATKTNKGSVDKVVIGRLKTSRIYVTPVDLNYSVYGQEGTLATQECQV